MEGRCQEEKDSSPELSGECDRVPADLLSRSNAATIEGIRKALSNFQGTRKNLMASPHEWMRDVMRDVLGGNLTLWRELSRVTGDVITSIEMLVEGADDTNIDFPGTTNIRTLYEDACKLKEHMKNGGKLGWGLFRPKEVKERLYVIKTVRIGGRPCCTVEHFSTLSDALHVRIECEKAWGFWVGRSDKTQGPYALQLTALKSLCDALENALSLQELIEKCRESIRQCPAISEPVWADESQVERMIASCRLAQDRQCKRLVAEEIQGIEAPASSIAATNNAHPVTNELLNSIRDHNVDGFANATSKIQELEKERQRLQRMDEYLLQLYRLLPSLTDELKRTGDEPYWDERLQHIGDAWHWAQARY
jgi:hypothetical protein